MEMHDNQTTETANQRFVQPDYMKWQPSDRA